MYSCWYHSIRMYRSKSNAEILIKRKKYSCIDHTSILCDKKKEKKDTNRGRAGQKILTINQWKKMQHYAKETGIQNMALILKVHSNQK